jgi:hypothetical protein
MSEIAAWQIPYSPAKLNKSCIATLPALQRGAVWKVRQIEELWDSIFQGFPLGSFLLSPHDPKLGFQPFKLQTAAATKVLTTQKNTHLLLDGQQRATGIALGFFDPWNNGVETNEIKNVLWIDLGKPTHTRDVNFVFRVLTRAHPWGYLCSDPDTRIPESQIRLSMSAFKEANHKLPPDTKPHQMHLNAVWPWDAQAPVPVAVLIGALTSAKFDLRKARKLAWLRVESLPFMQNAKSRSTEGSSEDGTKHWENQKQRVRDAFTNRKSEPAQHLDRILTILKSRMAAYVIPVMNVPISALEMAVGSSHQQSPIETLFIRINSAGTPLAGEELMYSLIKSAWTDAPTAINKLTYRLATPARIALLASRIVRARAQRTQIGEKKIPVIPTPTVEEFRRLIHGKNAEHPNFFGPVPNLCPQGWSISFYKSTRFPDQRPRCTSTSSGQ